MIYSLILPISPASQSTPFLALFLNWRLSRQLLTTKEEQRLKLIFICVCVYEVNFLYPPNFQMYTSDICGSIDQHQCVCFICKQVGIIISIEYMNISYYTIIVNSYILKLLLLVIFQHILFWKIRYKGNLKY